MEELLFQPVGALLNGVELGKRHRGTGQGLYRPSPRLHPVGNLIILTGYGIQQQLVELFDVHGEFRRASRGHFSRYSFRKFPPAHSCSWHQ